MGQTFDEIVATMTAEQRRKLYSQLPDVAKKVLAESEQEEKDKENAALIRELQQLQKFPTRNQKRIDEIVKILGW